MNVKSNEFSYKFTRGFTLIELLVAITVLGIAFAVVINSNAQVQRQARDTQRKSDLKIIQNALQMYYADKNFYPYNNTFMSDTLTDCSGSEFDPCTSITRTYLTVPKDPQTQVQYTYEAFSNFSATSGCDNRTSTKCHFYKLTATMESPVASFVVNPLDVR